MLRYEYKNSSSYKANKDQLEENEEEELHLMNTSKVSILEYKNIICAGYSAVMHIHSASVEVTLKALLCLIDKRTGEKSKSRPRFVKESQMVIMRLETAGIICMEPFKVHPQLGRFTLRDEGSITIN